MAEKPEYADPRQRFALRPISRDDDAAVTAMLTHTFSPAELPGAAQMLRADTMARPSAAYTEARAAYFIVESEGRIVGGGGFGPLPGARIEVCELRELWLLPEARGQGAATELAEHCLAVALAFGYRHCYAELLHTLRPAMRLLERLQFSLLNQPVGRTGRYLCDRWFLRDL